MRFPMTAPPKKRARAPNPEPTAAEVFGKALYEARSAAGMTQQEVAYASGLSLNRASLIEKGRSDVRLSSARALARAVGVPFNKMVGE